jgi:3,4-dihydroxy 2-butanone 4-phosphate synthase/GTP cyclohydrolase II
MKRMKVIGPMRLPSLLPNGTIGEFRLWLYHFAASGEYFVLEKGNLLGSEEALVRIHSACSFGILFNSQRCDCHAQLDEAMVMISDSDAGMLIYALPHEGRGVGVWNHVRVYMEQDKGEDTVSAYEVLGLPVDARDYSDVIEIIRHYGLVKVKLLTNNPAKVKALTEAQIEVTRVPLVPKLNEYNQSQIWTKIKKLGHQIAL